MQLSYIPWADFKGQSSKERRKSFFKDPHGRKSFDGQLGPAKTHAPELMGLSVYPDQHELRLSLLLVFSPFAKPSGKNTRTKNHGAPSLWPQESQQFVRFLGTTKGTMNQGQLDLPELNPATKPSLKHRQLRFHRGAHPSCSLGITGHHHTFPLLSSHGHPWNNTSHTPVPCKHSSLGSSSS